jgi:hypothetical protein
MGFLSFTCRPSGLLALLLGVLPAVRDLAQETLSQAREQYQAGRPPNPLRPTVSRLDPLALSQRVPSVSTGRLAQLLVAARPMGP